MGTLSVETYNISSWGRDVVIRMHGEEIANQLVEKLEALEAAGSQASTGN